MSVSNKQWVASDIRKQINDKDQRHHNTSKRAAVEGTISSVKRGHGAGKLKVRGKAKCQVVFGLKLLAHNFKQLVRAMTGDIRRSLQDAHRRQKREQIVAPKCA